jgi:hypothetical protein
VPLVFGGAVVADGAAALEKRTRMWRVQLSSNVTSCPWRSAQSHMSAHRRTTYTIAQAHTVAVAVPNAIISIASALIALSSLWWLDT